MSKLDNLHNHNISIQERTIYLGGSNSDDMDDMKIAEQFIKNMHILNNTEVSGEINVIMNLTGLEVEDGLAIFDSIKMSKNKVNIKVYGRAYSMGGVILQASDNRIMLPNSKLMLHYGKIHIDDAIKNAERWMADSKKDDEWTEQLFLNQINKINPEITLDYVKDLLKFDTILTAKESVKLGLADSIEGEV